MKIFNLSYNDKERFKEVYAITGKPYGFFKSIGTGGTGSPPLKIYDAPDEVMNIIRQNVDKKYTNIEILRDGILIRFKSRLENYGVPVNQSEITAIRFIPHHGKDFTSILEIVLADGKVFKFSVHKHEMAGLVKFFSKSIFTGKFNS